jgi:hypothetical protein
MVAAVYLRVGWELRRSTDQGFAGAESCPAPQDPDQRHGGGYDADQQRDHVVHHRGVRPFAGRVRSPERGLDLFLICGAISANPLVTSPKKFSGPRPPWWTAVGAGCAQLATLAWRKSSMWRTRHCHRGDRCQDRRGELPQVWKQVEIAAFLGVSPGTVAAQVFAGRNRLRMAHGDTSSCPPPGQIPRTGAAGSRAAAGSTDALADRRGTRVLR